VLNIRFRDWEVFFEWIDNNAPSGERYFCVRGVSDGYFRVIAVVQSARRRAYIMEDVDEEVKDDIIDCLDKREFTAVDNITGLE